MKYDEVGTWTEIKLKIIQDYAAEYSKIMANQNNPPFEHIYIDAFAGAGRNVSRSTGELVPGSAARALKTNPPFVEYHFIDLDSEKITSLEEMAGKRSDVFIYEEDCNKILLEKVFSEAKYEDYRRALCLLDPYGLHLNWKVIEVAGKMQSIEIFLNFPVHDMQRNVLWHDPKRVKQKQIERMNKFWGDESWKEVAYQPSFQRHLFIPNKKEKVDIDQLVEAFRKRLKNVADFDYVPDPVLFRNTNNTMLYYLFFASQKPVARKIVEAIFSKYRRSEL